ASRNGQDPHVLCPQTAGRADAGQGHQSGAYLARFWSFPTRGGGPARAGPPQPFLARANRVSTVGGRSQSIAVILRWPSEARPSKDDRHGPSPFEARFARASG